MTPRMTEIHADQGLRGGLREIVFPRSLAIVGASERNLRADPGRARGRCRRRPGQPQPRRGSRTALSPCDRRAPGRCPSWRSSSSRTRASTRRSKRRSQRECARSSSRASEPRPARTARRSSRGWARSPTRPGRLSSGRTAWGSRAPAARRRGSARCRETFVPGPCLRRRAVGLDRRGVARLRRRGSAFAASSRRGGEVNRDAADLLAFLAEDEGTRAIGLFLETVRRPAAFAAALERCAEAAKPVVCLKVGRSEAGRPSDPRAHRRARRVGAGVLRAPAPRTARSRSTDVHDLVETLEVLGRRRRPRRHPGRRGLRVGRRGRAPRRPGRGGRARASHRFRTRLADGASRGVPELRLAREPARRLGDRRRERRLPAARSS